MTYTWGGGCEPAFRPVVPLMCCVANCACVGAAPMTIARSVFVATFHKNPRMSASVTVETGRVISVGESLRAGCGATMRSQASA